MQYKKTDNAYVLRIEKGDEVIPVITDFCTEHKIDNAHFTGIGAVEYVRCGYYALDEKQYHFTPYDGLYEVASLTGNVILKDGAPFVHVHGVFTGTDNKAFGGHIESMRVGVVLEVILTPLSTSLSRTHDENIGLFLINCGDTQ